MSQPLAPERSPILLDPTRSPWASIHRILRHHLFQLVILATLASYTAFLELDSYPQWGRGDHENVNIRDMHSLDLFGGNRSFWNQCFYWNNGLISTSWQSFVMVPSIWLSERWLAPNPQAVDAPENALAYRFPNALYTFLGVIVLFYLAREILSPAVAFLATLFYASSPVFGTYAHLSHFVGATTTALLVMYLGLLKVGMGRSRFWWIVLTFGCLLPMFFYSPIRYMMFLVFPVLLFRFLFDRTFLRRNWWCALIFLLVLIAGYVPSLVHYGLVGGVKEYFRARGEQVMNMAEHQWWMEQVTGKKLTGPPSTQDRLHLTWKVIDQRAAEVGWAFTGQCPFYAFTDHWAARGRLFVPILIPFIWVGYFTAWSRYRYWPQLFLIAWAVLSILPLLLTSRFHAARVFVGFPAFMILGAQGVMAAAQGLRILVVPRFRNVVVLCFVSYFSLWVVVMGIYRLFRLLPEENQIHALRIIPYLFILPEFLGK